MCRNQNNSGTVLGYGNGSEAVFDNAQATTLVGASTCLNGGGVFVVTQPCGVAPPVKPDAYQFSQTNEPTPLGATAETNNLVPLSGFGKLPPVNFVNNFEAQIVYTANATGNSGPVIGEVGTAGQFELKQGISSLWDNEATAIKRVAIADDPTGPFVGALDASGNFWVKHGFIGGWTPEASNVTQIAIADDSVGPVIGELDSLGNFSVKQGLSGTWTSEAAHVAQVAISGWMTNSRLG